MLRFILPERGRRAASACLTALLAFSAAPAFADEPLLVLEQKIPLGKVGGRIDHLAINLERQRLFVAELGNNSVGIVDLHSGRLMRNLDGFRKPQGVAYVKSTDTLYVSNAGDGAVQLFQGPDFVPAGRIELGEDADNIRVDMKNDKVFVGYGSGALAVIDSVAAHEDSRHCFARTSRGFPAGGSFRRGNLRRICPMFGRSHWWICVRAR